MNRVLVLLALSLAATTAAFELSSSRRSRSFEDAVRECAQYYLLEESCIQRYLSNPALGNDIDSRLTRCALLDLKAWNDTTGIWEPALRQFFQPSGCDREFRERTHACIQDLRSYAADDVNGRATDSFLCYLRNYGTLIRSEKKFVPLGYRAIRKLDGFLMANTPRCVLLEFSRGNFARESEIALPLYISTARGGCVSDGKIVLDRLYTQFGTPQLLDPRTAQCQDEVVNEYRYSNDVVGSLYQQFKRCFCQYTPILKLMQEVAEELVNTKDCDC